MHHKDALPNYLVDPNSQASFTPYSNTQIPTRFPTDAMCVKHECTPRCSCASKSRSILHTTWWLGLVGFKEWIVRSVATKKALLRKVTKKVQTEIKAGPGCFEKTSGLRQIVQGCMKTLVASSSKSLEVLTEVMVHPLS